MSIASIKHSVLFSFSIVSPSLVSLLIPDNLPLVAAERVLITISAPLAAHFLY
nr:MAG TPA: hypothetical protein [Caudoviricetes sp.]